MIAARPQDPDRRYEHRFHAGNAGDVWKHLVWLELVAGLRAGQGRLDVVETHAGAGRYRLGGTGEWMEGVGRLAGWIEAPRAVQALARAQGVPAQFERVTRYEGSPRLSAASIGESGCLRLFEADGAAAEQLARAMEPWPNASVVTGDGWSVRPAHRREVLFVDPPFAERDEWSGCVELAARWRAEAPGAMVAIWYPIKGANRPAALVRSLRELGCPGWAAELWTAPFDTGRSRLNGSGMAVLHPPAAAITSIAEAAGWLGPRLAVRDNDWQFRVTAWGGA
jgi:23S rRNA (adenine2030-N6)-methyltransferase